MYCSHVESEAVQIAAANLEQDLKRTGQMDVLWAKEEKAQIVIGTLGVWNNNQDDKKNGLKLDLLRGEDGDYKKEAYLMQVEGETLYLLGTDRRGCIYAIYDLCERLGVSPWHFFADVPVKKWEEFRLEEGFTFSDHPSVEYRGIFINDEEELNHWVQLHMGEQTIGVKTYEKIFELLLRLKMNYIWPAMHVNSFNLLRENGELANRMGIVVGTSHCDMLMRSNNKEWIPWITKKGYFDAKYDYSIEGRNREILNEYWQESVEQNKEFEVSYTLGMRGIHDSGFDTEALKNMSKEEQRTAKTKLLETVMQKQQEILNETLGHKTMKTFVPYKEVLELYDHGLKVPEDITLIWVNDNYGSIRRYPSEEERKRSGGNGIYYHNSYWAPSGRSYVFLCSIPLAHTRNELLKAYQEGCRKLWVLNVGAIKPLETEISFYAKFAWEVGKKGALTEDVDSYLEDFINRTFTTTHSREIAGILNDFSQIANVRKIENMDYDLFSQTAYGDEGAVIMNRIRQLFLDANAIYDEIKDDEKDAYFQLILMKIHALYFTHAMYYYADRSTLCVTQGKMQAAALYTKRSLEFEDARQKLLYYYGNVMADGKWSGILTPEDFPPPRTAMHPACTPPLSIGKRGMVIHAWNGKNSLEFISAREKWFEIGNTGEGEFEYEILCPEWVHCSKTKGSVRTEERILVSVSDRLADQSGVIRIHDITDDIWKEISVQVTFVWTDCNNIEEDGKITVEADSVEKDCLQDSSVQKESEQNNFFMDNSMQEDAGKETSMGQNQSLQTVQSYGWKIIRRLGRGYESLIEAEQPGAVISYPFFLRSEGEFLLELHRFPSLNSTGRIRIGVQADEGEIKVVESLSNDEWKGNWEENSLNNVDKLYMKLPALKKGMHYISFHAIDRYFAFSRFVIYTKERLENNMGGIEGDQSFPEELDLMEFTEKNYGAITLLPRKEIYSPEKVNANCNDNDDISIQSVVWAKPVTPDEILSAGTSLFEEKEGTIKIDAATALAQSKYAYTRAYDWQYCNSETHGRTGLAMYIREKRKQWERNTDAPSLQYRMNLNGGSYTIWVHMKIKDAFQTRIALGMDGVLQEEDSVYQGYEIFRFSAEQAWRWVPLWKNSFREGEHTLGIYLMSSGMRIDRIYMTKGNELPPEDYRW